MNVALPAASVCGRSASGMVSGLVVLVGVAIVLEAEHITVKARTLGRLGDLDLAFEVEPRSRRAVKETPIHA